MASPSEKSFTSDQILNSAEFKELVKERRKLLLPIVAIIIIAYFSFILTVAFNPTVLGITIGDGKVSIGIYLGLGLLVLSFLLTAVYLRLSDGKIAEIQKKIQRKFNS